MVVNFLFIFFFECFSIHDFSKDGGRLYIDDEWF